MAIEQFELGNKVRVLVWNVYIMRFIAIIGVQETELMIVREAYYACLGEQIGRVVAIPTEL